MGSELQFKLVTYDADPMLALQRLQEDVASQFEISETLRRNLTDLQDAYDSTLDDDPCGLRELYAEELAHARDMAARDVPTEPAAKIDFIRELHRFSEEGTGTFLDIRGVIHEPEYDIYNAYVCDDPSGEIGVERIPSAKANEYAYELASELNRGQSMMVPTYDEPDADQPTHWLIVRMSID